MWPKWDEWNGPKQREQKNKRRRFIHLALNSLFMLRNEMKWNGFMCSLARVQSLAANGAQCRSVEPILSSCSFPQFRAPMEASQQRKYISDYDLNQSHTWIDGSLIHVHSEFMQTSALTEPSLAATSIPGKYQCNWGRVRIFPLTSIRILPLGSVLDAEFARQDSFINLIDF